LNTDQMAAHSLIKHNKQHAQRHKVVFEQQASQQEGQEERQGCKDVT